MAGRLHDADAAYRQSLTLLDKLGRAETTNATTLYNNWALVLIQMGRPLEAEQLFRRAIAISKVDETEDSVSPMMLTNYARTLRDLGRLSEAADYAERSYALAQRAGGDRVINMTMTLLVSIYRGLGDSTRSAAMLSAVEPRMRRSLPPSTLGSQP